MLKKLPVVLAISIPLGACGGASNVVIPDSLRAPCVSTVDVSGAQTVGDLGRAIVQGDGDLRVCDVRREAVVAIAEARNRSWWQLR
jgi:hypothetical protein